MGRGTEDGRGGRAADVAGDPLSSATEFADLIRRRAGLFAAAMLFGLGAAAGYLLLASPTYQATALVLVDPSRKDLMRTDAGPASAPGDSARIDSEVELMRSDALLLDVIETEGLRSDPDFAPSPSSFVAWMPALLLGRGEASTEGVAIEKLRDTVTIRRRGLTHVIAIDVRSPSAATAASLANAFARVHIQRQLAEKAKAFGERRDTMRRRMEEARSAAAEAQARYRDFLDGTVRSAALAALAEETAPQIVASPTLDLEASFAPASSRPAPVTLGEAELHSALQSAARDHQSFLERFRELETQTRLQVADSRLASPALAPTAPISPDPVLVLAAAALLSVGLGTGLAFVADGVRRDVGAPVQLRALMGGATVAAVPFERCATAQRSLADAVIDDPLSPFAKGIGHLRDALDGKLAGARPDRMGEGRIVLVTSARAGEGKTTLALSLARSLALEGRRVLLIDCDVRRPTLHAALGVPVRASLPDLVGAMIRREDLGTVTVDDPKVALKAILSRREDGVWADDLLNRMPFLDLLARTVRLFDHVVLDAPAVGEFPEEPALLSRADAIVFVVEAHRTDRAEVRAALRALHEAGAAPVPPLLVLNRMSEAHA